MSVEDSNVSLALMAEFLTVLVNKWQRIYKWKKKRQNNKKGLRLFVNSVKQKFKSCLCHLLAV